MGIFEKLSDYLAKERNLAELGSLVEQDLAELASDPNELRQAILARPRVREQMLAMAERFGLTEEDVTQPHWREMEVLHVCQNCASSKQCNRFLNGKSTEFRAMDCPNALTYAEVSADKL